LKQLNANSNHSKTILTIQMQIRTIALLSVLNLTILAILYLHNRVLFTTEFCASDFELQSTAWCLLIAQ